MDPAFAATAPQRRVHELELLQLDPRQRHLVWFVINKPFSSSGPEPSKCTSIHKMLELDPEGRSIEIRLIENLCEKRSATANVISTSHVLVSACSIVVRIAEARGGGWQNR